MSIIPNSFTAVGAGAGPKVLSLKAGQSAHYFVSGTFVGTVKLQKSINNGQTWTDVASATGSASGTFDAVVDTLLRFYTSAYTSGTIVTTIQDAGNTTDNALIALLLGAVNPVAGLQCVADINPDTGVFKIDFVFNSVSVTHTDAAGSGSSGSLKLFDFVQGAIQSLASKSNLTLTSDATMDTAGDMAGVFAFGSAAANAGDGALTGTEVDFVATTAFTLSSNTLAVGTTIKGAGAAGVDGTSTAADLYLNESGSAATSDANGVMTVTGDFSLVGVIMKDD